MNKTTPEKILALLPQTQCRKCGHNCCHDYAKAIAEGAPINCCPTGGVKGIQRLARLMGKPFIPLNPQYGKERARDVAIIDESLCIGCRLCIKVCPVDAIVGANGVTHTVLPAKCTGCDLCLAACPVDGIIMKNISGNKTGWNAWSPVQAKRARANYEFRRERLKREEEREQARLQSHTKTKKTGEKKAIVLAAIEKARIRSEKNT